MKKCLVLFFTFLVPILCFAQNNVVSLDAALEDASYDLVGRLKSGSKVVVLNMDTPPRARGLADYMIDELSGYLVNSGKLTVVDRRNLELIQQEMNFQMSGEVSDETAQEIGRKLGAQFIISGSLTSLGGMYRMRVQAIAVETAQIQVMFNANVGHDQILTALLGGGGSVSAVSVPTQSSATGDKPVKKIPAQANNFEIIQGKMIRVPIDMTKFATSAKTAITAQKYNIDKESDAVIIFTVSGGAGRWWAQIRLCYWEDEYWYEYADSYDLGANPARNRIHRNYYNWIALVEKQLYRAYYGE